MQTLALAVLAVSTIFLLTGVISGVVRRSLISIPLIALAAGVLLGPLGAGLLQPATWGNPYLLLEGAAFLTLGIGLMSIALRLPRGDLRRRWRALAVLLGLVMTAMWLVSTALICGILRLPPLVGLVAAAITPTDPILARAVVDGDVARRFVPEPARLTLTEESAINDGLGLPFVALSLALLTVPLGKALGPWMLNTILWAIAGGAALGLAIGWGAAWLVRWAGQRRLVDPGYWYAIPVALSLFALTGVHALGADGVLAAFTAGVGYAAVRTRRNRQAEQLVQATVNNLVTVPVFVLLGAALPWANWLALGWPALLLPAGILVFRRLPAVLLFQPLLRRQFRDYREAAFAGWFGPMGVSALFYATLIVQQTGLQAVWTVVALVITSSVIAHGVTAVPLARWLGRHERPAG